MGRRARPHRRGRSASSSRSPTESRSHHRGIFARSAADSKRKHENRILRCRVRDHNLFFIKLNKEITSSRSAASLLALMESRGDDFNDVNMSTAIHRLGSRFSPFFEHYREPEAGLRKVMDLCVLSIARGELSPRSLANVAWGLARLGVVATALFAAIAHETPYRVFEFGPQDLANLCWAFAKADVDAPALFEAIQAAVPAQINNFTSQHLSSTVWAFAKSDAHAPQLFTCIEIATIRQIHEFAPIDLANTAWAFACVHGRHGFRHPDVFDMISREIPPKVNDCSPQNIATIAAAFALARPNAAIVFESIALEATSRIHDFNAQELAASSSAEVCVETKPHTSCCRQRHTLLLMPCIMHQHSLMPLASRHCSEFHRTQCQRSLYEPLMLLSK